MTHTPTSPPAGWYPAPDGSSELRWWDGAQWGPAQPQAAQPQTQPQPIYLADPGPAATNAIARLAMAVQVLLVVSAVMCIVTIGVEVFGIVAVTDFLGGDDANVDRFDVYDLATAVVSIAGPVFLLTTGVLWVIWQYRVAKQVRGLTRRVPGWHAGAWFVPIICLWFPYQNISDLWRAVGRTRPSWQIAWWLLWVVSNFVSTQATRIYLSAEDLETLRVAMWVNLAAEVLLLAAAPLAWLVIRGITEGIARRAANPVPSLVG